MSNEVISFSFFLLHFSRMIKQKHVKRFFLLVMLHVGVCLGRKEHVSSLILHVEGILL